MNHDMSKMPEILDRHAKSPESLIAVLQDIQKEFHYLPCEALKATAEALDLPMSRVSSVATFYNAFSLNPRGETIIKVCKGTACHIRGAELIADQFETQLGIKAGETTEDMKFTLEVVAGVGACAMAPVVLIDERYHGSVKPTGVKKLLKVKKHADS